MNYRSLVGQSAIEYLMTYGWMLLVVAIVGGAIFSTVGNQSIESVNGFSGGDVVVENFGINSDGFLTATVRNTNSEEVNINYIELTDGDSITKFQDSQSISVSENKMVMIDTAEFSDGGGSNTIQMKINYDSGGLNNLETSGEISGSLSIDRTVPVSVENSTAYWPIDDGSGTEIGSFLGEYNGEASFSTWTDSPGSEDPGLNFSEGDEDVKVVNNGELTDFESNEFTFGAWIRPQDLDRQQIISAYDPDRAFQFRLYGNNEGSTLQPLQPQVVTYDGSDYDILSAGEEIPSDKFSFVVITGKADITGEGRVFINGTEAALGSPFDGDTGGIQNVNSEVFIGSQKSDRYFDGYIQRVFIDDDIWSQDRVEQFYNETKAYYGH